jgi:hypothetical protein
VFPFVEIFTQPGKVFTRVSQKQVWVQPFLAVVFLLTLPTVLVIFTAGIEILTLQRYQHDPKLAEAIGGEAAVERAVLGSNDRWTKSLVVSRVGGTAAAGIVVLAGAFTLATWIFDSRPNYFVMLGTLCYSLFPFVLLGAVLSLILLNTVSDHSSLDLENMPALNLSRLLDRSSANPAIYAMAGGMDLLIAGEMLLMSFGLTKVTRLSYLQGLAICGGIWTIAVLWKAAIMVYL